MKVQPDDKTEARILKLAALQQVPPEQLAAEWLRKVSKYQEETAEDMQRLADMEADGGIPHDEMMDWLEQFALGNVQ